MKPRSKAKPRPRVSPLQRLWNATDLFNADPKCKHNVRAAPGGGVKCTKCPGWFCY